MSSQRIISVRYRARALSDIWTGTVEFQRKNDRWREVVVNKRLITTCLLGSIRWWFEAVVRGLGGYACDPTDTRCIDGDHCVVCELFGCTGWARKFRFDALKNDKPRGHSLERGDSFELSFTALRPIRKEEWALLDLTVRLIAKYAAIGGKTIYKPSNEPGRENRSYHRDYGLFEILGVEQKPHREPVADSELRDYVNRKQWRREKNHEAFEWASLENFWYVHNRFLTRYRIDKSTFNEVLGRYEPKDKSQQLAIDSYANRWLAGVRKNDDVDEEQAETRWESKKVFSFKQPKRTYGFQKPGTIGFEEICLRLKTVWKDFQDQEFLTFKEIWPDLLREANIS